MKFRGRIIQGEFVPEKRGGYEDYLWKQDGELVTIEILNISNQRTLPQNRAIHKWCELVAEELNDAGLDIKKFYEGGMDIPWSKETVKEHIWKVGMEYHHLPDTSTTKLTRTQVNEVYDICNRALGARGVHVDFPTFKEE